MSGVTVADVMTYDAVSATADAPYRDLVDQIDRFSRVPTVQVVDPLSTVDGGLADVLATEVYDGVVSVETASSGRSGTTTQRPSDETRRLAMRVRDIMTRPVFTVRPTDPVEGAAALLADRGITAAPVIDERNRLVGMVSEGDLLRDRVPEDPTAHLRAAPPPAARRPRIVVEVMTHDVVTAWPTEDVSDVARTMLDRDVRSVPVLDGGHVIGIISRRDLLRSVLRTDDVLANDVQQRLDAYADEPRRWTATVTDGVVRIDGAVGDEAERSLVEILARTVPGVAAVTVPNTAHRRTSRPVR